MDYEKLRLTVGTVFTPRSPVNERDLFAGRIEQLQKVAEAVSQRGSHAVLYGERGVGKTSLSNVIADVLGLGVGEIIVAKVTCTAADDFATLWQKAFEDVLISSPRLLPGFGSDDEITQSSLADRLPSNLTPHHVRRVLEGFSRNQPFLIIFDEFDRVLDVPTSDAMADTIKVLSDHGVNASILIVGVSDSVAGLIRGHGSIERALVQVPMPRMSADEMAQIIDNGLRRLGMAIQPKAKRQIITLSQGLPYITHLLALHATKNTIDSTRPTISVDDVDKGIHDSLNQWQESIKTSYYQATTSAQPGNIFKEVLLACALTEPDELGFFTAASVRAPLRKITSKTYDIPNFARHLKEFSSPNRGEILERVGQVKKLRYRFTSPLMRPYIVMRGYTEKMLTQDV